MQNSTGIDMSNDKVAIVVPTCRGYLIQPQSIPVKWYVVHDSCKIRNDDTKDAVNIRHFDKNLYGEKSDSIRSVGFLQAVADGADFILSTDDDCVLPINWAKEHVSVLKSEIHPWWFTTNVARPRGMPYEADKLPVAISHGLWNGVPDMDARTQLETKSVMAIHDDTWERINPPFSQCAMNFGFRAEVLNSMYQPFQGVHTPFDRFADIWGGLVSQRTLMGHGYSFMNGGACVHHERASDAEVNLEKEKPGIECNELLWKHIWNFNSWGSTTEVSYLRLSEVLKMFGQTKGGSKWEPYFNQLSLNMQTWTGLVKNLSQ